MSQSKEQQIKWESPHLKLFSTTGFNDSLSRDWQRGCWADIKSTPWTPASVLCMPGLLRWAPGCYTVDSSSLFPHCRATTHPSSSSCLQWLFLSKVSASVPMLTWRNIKYVECRVLYLGSVDVTFSPTRDLTASSRVADGTHAVTPGACWGRWRYFNCHNHYRHWYQSHVIMNE